MSTELSDDDLIMLTLRKHYASYTPSAAQEDLQEKYGETWTDEELLRDFGVQFFDGPRVHVIRKQDGAHGTVAFVDTPRFYFAFIPDNKKNANKTLAVTASE
jgi:hypothetical protein